MHLILLPHYAARCANGYKVECATGRAARVRANCYFQGLQLCDGCIDMESPYGSERWRVPEGDPNGCYVVHPIEEYVWQSNLYPFEICWKGWPLNDECEGSVPEYCYSDGLQVVISHDYLQRAAIVLRWWAGSGWMYPFVAEISIPPEDWGDGFILDNLMAQCGYSPGYPWPRPGGFVGGTVQVVGL